MNRAIVCFAAAVVAVIGILPGAMVQGALASGGTPSPLVFADTQVDADPTPTPTPSPPTEATPTPAPSPSPTPTPTPFDESEASITALSVIDEDGDPGTVDDRHVFDGEWEFAGEFGTAEVVSADPTSSGSEAAHWFIDYEGVTRVVITDLLRDGYMLLDVECVARSDSREWEVDGTSVIWFPPLPAAGPSGFNCEFIHAAVESAMPRITLPPTDVGGDGGGRLGTWPPLLLLLLATAGSVLTLKLNRRGRTEH
jgi:hypothetical protein